MDRGALLGQNLKYLPKGDPRQAMGLLSMALPSPAGDAVGLLGDAYGYAQDPRSLTLGSGLLSLAGMVPGVPSKALWVDAAGGAIKSKALRKALGMLRPDAGSIDDQIVNLKRMADTYGDTVPAKKDIESALKVLEKHRGAFFPGPSVSKYEGVLNQDYSPAVRGFGPPAPAAGMGAVPPYLRR